jgi:hypothetical protein
LNERKGATTTAVLLSSLQSESACLTGFSTPEQAIARIFVLPPHAVSFNGRIVGSLALILARRLPDPVQCTDLCEKFEDCGRINILRDEFVASLATAASLPKVWFCSQRIGRQGGIERLPLGVGGPKIVLEGTSLPWAAPARSDGEAWLQVKGRVCTNTAATGSRSVSRSTATTCSSENLDLRIIPSVSGGQSLKQSMVRNYRSRSGSSMTQNSNQEYCLRIMGFSKICTAGFRTGTFLTYIVEGFSRWFRRDQDVVVAIGADGCGFR